jgi:hypothetical protein
MNENTVSKRGLEGLEHILNYSRCTGSNTVWYGMVPIPTISSELIPKRTVFLKTKCPLKKAFFVVK